jgi:hypothetical protein
MNSKTSTGTAVNETLIRCPNCDHEIRLTESLAGPLLEETHRKYDAVLKEKDADVARKTEALRQEREQVAKTRLEIEDEVVRRLGSERTMIVASEAQKARREAAAELLSKETEASELREALAINNAKLADAQRIQADLMRQRRALEDEKREFDLTIEKRVQASSNEIRERAKQEADDAARLRVLERENTIESMARTIEELKRKAEQGSEQGRGEIFEVALEDTLRSKFPSDIIEPVAKGESGADIVQRINQAVGPAAGTILYESKRTKAWNDHWLNKLREDQRRCGADLAVIVSQALPRNVRHFDLVDGIWVTHPACAVPVALALRQTLVELDGSRLAQEGQQTKMQQVYRYLTGTKFRQRVEAVVEKFDDLREDLEKERKFMGRQWAKRELQIVSVVDSTTGMIGDLQAIAGKAMPRIDNLDAPLLDGPDDEHEAKD